MKFPLICGSYNTVIYVKESAVLGGFIVKTMELKSYFNYFIYLPLETAITSLAYILEMKCEVYF